MMDEQDRRDKVQARRIAIGVGLVLVLWIVGAVLVLGLLGEFFAQAQAGLGWRDAAIVSFFLSTTLVVVFALVGGDGLLGELPSMLLGLVGLFLILWFALATIF